MPVTIWIMKHSNVPLTENVKQLPDVRGTYGRSRRVLLLIKFDRRSRSLFFVISQS
jgi:hypothetical protein